MLISWYACSLPQNSSNTAHGPLLKHRETRLTDGFPVTRFMLFEQDVAYQKRDATPADLNRRDHDHTP